MVASEISRVKRAVIGLAPFVVLVSLLLSGCGATSIFNAPAPLASHVTIPYSVGGSGATTAGLTALNGRDGNDAWHAATGEPSTHFQPIMVNGIVYTEGGTAQASSLVAVRASDGRTLWKAPMPNANFTIASDGVIVLAQAKADGLFALDAATGALRWRVDQPAADPVYVKDGVAVATITDAQGQGAHLAVYQEADGKPLWQLIYAALAGINHSAVYTSESNEILAYAARTGKELWHSEIAGDLVSVNDQSVLVSSSQHVASLDAATGHTLWDVPVEFDSWIGIVQTPTVVYGAHNNSVIALSFTNGTPTTLNSEFSNYTVTQITEVQGVLFAMLAGAPESSTPARVAALDGATGRVYWQRDIQEILFLANNVQLWRERAIGRAGAVPACLSMLRCFQNTWRNSASCHPSIPTPNRPRSRPTS